MTGAANSTITQLRNSASKTDCSKQAGPNTARSNPSTARSTARSNVSTNYATMSSHTSSNSSYNSSRSGGASTRAPSPGRGAVPNSTTNLSRTAVTNRPPSPSRQPTINAARAASPSRRGLVSQMTSQNNGRSTVQNRGGTTILLFKVRLILTFWVSSG